MKILVIGDKLGNYEELCGAVDGLAGESIAFTVLGGDEAGSIPAKKVYRTQLSDSNMYEDCFDTIKELISTEKPEAVFLNATKKGKYMAARLAASLGTSAMTDMSNVVIEDGCVKGSQMYYGGVALRTLKSKGTAVVTLSAGGFEPASGSAGEVAELPLVDNGFKIVRKEVQKKEVKTVNLAAAKKVVGAGRGFGKQEDLSMAEQLASALGGEFGCSRPIAEGEGWMDISRYIGVSGVMLKPDVYFAVGISGQVQHTIGISSAKTIIAINKDKNAPIFKVCDYGIVGDLYKILPALTDMIKAG
ncbi:MAG: electron transfer flavoprotein subunit alpha/FixB family protein [Deferribacterales bacterium]|jgi:electron transfer flavoprotein alpha subunit